jgi:hypothetical protein
MKYVVKPFKSWEGMVISFRMMWNVITEMLGSLILGWVLVRSSKWLLARQFYTRRLALKYENKVVKGE